MGVQRKLPSLPPPDVPIGEVRGNFVYLTDAYRRFFVELLLTLAEAIGLIP